MVGQRLGSYLVVRKLGEGGMGTVYEALYEPLGRRVALKVLHPEFCQRAPVIHRFFNEARAVNIVQHPGIVGVYEYGQAPDGTAYLVMEYLAGESLSARLVRCGRLPDCLNLVRQMATALCAAHERGVVHRDLKPGNIMLVPDPEALGGERAKILDFGVAKVAVEHQGPERDQFMTRSGMVMGTPMYMSPEQCRSSGAVDDRSDVYSLGVMMYQMISGMPPFQAAGLGEVMALHLYAAPPPLVEAAPGTAEGLVALVHLMLSKDATARPSMVEVVTELERLGAKSTQALPAFVASGGLAAPGTGSGPVVAGAPGRASSAGMPPLSPVGTVVGSAVTPASMAGQAQSFTAPQTAKGRVLALGLLVSLAVLGFGIYEALRPKPHGVTALPPPPPPAPRVRWTVESQPPGAQVVRETDGVVLGRTPWQGEHAAEPGQLMLRLRQPGYRDGHVVIDLMQGYTGTVPLEPLQKEPAKVQDEPAKVQDEPARAKEEPAKGDGAKGEPAKGERRSSRSEKKSQGTTDKPKEEDDEELQLRPLR